jgi:pyrimidine operon attenuation protein/uracil phosphoribosyltransferase
MGSICLSWAFLITSVAMSKLFDQARVKSAFDAWCRAICAAFPPHEPINIIGIRTRGETLAERLARAMASCGFSKIGRGVLDITLYRDDLSEIGPRPMVRPSEMNVQLDGVPVLLVDDVLFTGRSARAALDALTDYGRPSVIKLAVLVDRGGRELPIQADFVGLTLKDVPRDHRVNVQLCEDDGCDRIVVEPKP